MPCFPRLLFMALLLAPGLVRGQEGAGAAPRRAFAWSLPLVFDSEHIALPILGDSREVRGLYAPRCQGRSETPTPLLDPFAQDTLLGGFRFVSLALRPGAAGPDLPARFDAIPGIWAPRWQPWPPAAIPFTLSVGKVILPVTVGDSRALRIILDTGMSFDGLLVTNPALRDSIALPGAVAAQLGGAGAGPAQRALMADSLGFRVGTLELPGQRVVVLQSELMRGFANDGVCGQSLFGHYAVELDYARGLLRLHPPGGFAADSTWTAIPLYFKAHGVPWLDLTVSIAGADSVQLAAYVDLAASETVELLTGDGQRFALPAVREAAYLGRGLGGDIHGERGEIAWVALGAQRVERVNVAFVDDAIRSKQPGAEAVVDGGLLCKFHCVFDYAAGRLYLKPLD